MKKLSACTFILLFIFHALTLQAGTPVPDGKYFPSLPGWSKPDSLATYQVWNLWDIIDGAADGYLNYDFEELTMGDYKGSEGHYITLEIYRHHNPVNAFGIYSQERQVEGGFLPIGVQGYAAEGVLNFLADRYYVKIRSPYYDPETAAAIKTLAEQIASLIGSSEGMPATLKLFPADNKIQNSEQYINKNFLGYSIFSGAFTCNYSAGDQIFSVFVIPQEDPSKCSEMLSKYLEQLNTGLAPEEGKGFLLNDKYNGMVGILWKGNHIYGFYNTLSDAALQQKYFGYFKTL
jgi:hypothetical protein